MLNFICVGLVEWRGTRNKQKLQNEKFSPTLGFEPSISYLDAITPRIWLISTKQVQIK